MEYLNIHFQKKMCVSDRPTDPKILPATLTFFMPKKIIDRQNPEIRLPFPYLFPTSTIDSVSCLNFLHFLVHCSPGFYGTTVVNV
jgi:hypothetical protein